MIKFAERPDYSDGRHLFQQKVSTSYAYGLTIEEFQKVTRKDDEEEDYERTLGAKLERLEGVRDVEYNGHFGPFIYYTIDVDHDGSKTHSDIFDLIWEAYQ